MMPSDPKRPSLRQPRIGLAIVGLLLIAVNLRVSFVSVGPVLANISHDLSLSSTQAGLLTGLPLVAFAVFSPVGPAVSACLGLDRALWMSLLILASGIVLRSLSGPGCLWVGTALIGLGIAVLNVLVPSFVKRDFPGRVTQLTGMYSATQAAVAAMGAALVVPIAQTSPSGWRLALGIWVGLAGIALAVLLPWLRKPAFTPATRGTGVPSTFRSPWGSVLGWQVTCFMGLQSIAFYVLMAWLPTIEQSRGTPATTAGAHLSIFLLISVLSSLIAGTVLNRGSDQRPVSIVTSALMLVTFLGLAAAPQLTPLWVVTGAIGCGSLIVIALTLFSLRTTSPSQAGSLSGMAQAIGYGLAALGPAAFGVLRDLSGSWVPSLLVVAGLMVVLTWLGSAVGHNRLLN